MDISFPQIFAKFAPTSFAGPASQLSPRGAIIQPGDTRRFSEQSAAPTYGAAQTYPQSQKLAPPSVFEQRRRVQSAADRHTQAVAAKRDMMPSTPQLHVISPSSLEMYRRGTLEASKNMQAANAKLAAATKRFEQAKAKLDTLPATEAAHFQRNGRLLPKAYSDKLIAEKLQAGRAHEAAKNTANVMRLRHSIASLRHSAYSIAPPNMPKSAPNYAQSYNALQGKQADLLRMADASRTKLSTLLH